MAQFRRISKFLENISENYIWIRHRSPTIFSQFRQHSVKISACSRAGCTADCTVSKYFLYYALGTRSCNVRWIEYLDWITDEPLLAGCLPFYSPTTTPETSALRGVSCVDMNMVVRCAHILEHTPGVDQLPAKIT